MATIRDVAKLAGVAPITVSRVINGHESVSPATRAKVEAAVEELAYIPNALGPSLRTRRTGTIALLLSDLRNPFMMTVARGVEDAARRHGRHVIMCNTDDSPAKQADYFDLLMRKQIDGFVLLPTTIESIDPLLRHQVPVIVLDRSIPDLAVDTVRGDSVGAARDLVRHLVGLGHERIAIVTGPRSISTAVDRVTGYEQGLAEAGLERHRCVLWGEYMPESGQRLTHEVLAAERPPTAIIAGNNFIAIGVMRALLAEGLRVPDDVSVATIDDLPAILTIDPFFTCAAQPAYEIGERATELLISRVDGSGPDEHQDIVLPVDIIERRSTAAPRVGSVGLRAAAAAVEE